MTTRTKPPQVTTLTNVALVWIDRDHAVIVSGEAQGKNTVECLERELDESRDRFEARTIDQVVDEDRVIVSGPAFARTSFERLYVAATRRPDRLVDIEPTILGRQPPPKALIGGRP